MKTFTKLFLALVLLCVAGVANAGETLLKLQDYGNMTGSDGNPTETYPYWWMGDRSDNNPVFPNFCGGTATVEVVNGALKIVNNQEQTNNYDLQPFVLDWFNMKKQYEYRIEIYLKASKEGSANLSVGIWGTADNAGIQFTASDDFVKYTATIAQSTVEATQNNAHVVFQSGKFVGTIEVQKVAIYEITPDDPLAAPRQELRDAIAAAKLQDPFAKTDASFAVLTAAISSAETAVDAGDATAESLAAAKKAIEDAVNGFVYIDGYTKLTADMYKQWDNNLAPTSGTATGCAYELCKSTGQPYGDGSVQYLKFADISAYDKLILLVKEGTPRVMLNRQAVGVGGGDSNGGGYVQLTDAAVDGKVEIDLSQWDYAHLNAIKGANYSNVTISDMVLYKAADPLESYKENLKKAIDMGKLANPIAKTEDSFAALTNAISAGETALNASNATQQSLTDAKEAIEAAFNALTLQEGYENLTADMFKKYASVNEPGEPQATGCSYELYKASGLPYGDASVGELNWADLTGYDKLIIATVGDVKPRLCMNRLVKDGQQAATQEESKMLDINPNNGNTWSTEKYETIEDNIFTIDLKAIVADYTFARLHSIKGQGGNVLITDLLLVKSAAAPVAAEATFDFNAMDVPTSTNDSNDGEIVESKTIVENGVTMIITPADPDNKTPNRFWGTAKGPQLRMYSGLMSIVAPEGKAITKVVFDNAKWNADNTINEVAAATGEWEGNTDGIMLYIAGNTQFNKVTVTLTDKDANTVATGIQELKTTQAKQGIYDLMGRRVAQPVKGLYIVNGKKVMVK